MINIFKKEEKKSFTYASIEMRKSSNKSIFWIIGTLVFIGIGFLIYHKAQLGNNFCKVSVENVSFTDTTIQDSTQDNKDYRIYKGEIKNTGKVNIALKGVRAKLYNSDNKIIEESYLNYKGYNLALSQRIELNVVLGVNKGEQITRYEFTPEYTCSIIGSYIN